MSKATLLLATTGMRRGEALGLRWRDVSLDQARLSVLDNLDDGEKVILRVSPSRTS